MKTHAVPSSEPQSSKVAIVTGASSGLGPALTQTLLKKGFPVVRNSRNISKSKNLTASTDLVLVDGDIGKKETPANGSSTLNAGPATRIRELGLVLPAPPAPLGAYVESADSGNLLFLTGMLPVVKGKLAVTGRLGDELEVEAGQKAAWISALNALAAAQHHLGDLDRLKRLLKLTVQIATTERFVEHAAVADGASNLFVQVFGADKGHTRVVFGVQSMPIGAPVMIETIFEIC